MFILEKVGNWRLTKVKEPVVTLVGEMRVQLALEAARVWTVQVRVRVGFSVNTSDRTGVPRPRAGNRGRGGPAVKLCSDFHLWGRCPRLPCFSRLSCVFLAFWGVCIHFHDGLFRNSVFSAVISYYVICSVPFISVNASFPHSLRDSWVFPPHCYSKLLY